MEPLRGDAAVQRVINDAGGNEPFDSPHLKDHLDRLDGLARGGGGTVANG